MSKAIMRADIAFSRPYMFAEEQEAAAQVIAGGWIVGGPRLAELEARFARLCNKKHGIGVSSWTTGAFLVLKAWDIGIGDEVIVPSYSFIASANVIRHAGATPVFCDIDLKTYNIDVDHASSLINAKTKAIIPVDQLGMPCDMDAINALAKKHGLRVLEDAACAVGSTYKGHSVGANAEVSTFSLHARKLVSCGEGGMIVTDDDDMAHKLRLLRHHGMNLTDFERHKADKPLIESYEMLGYNMRITDIQSAIALVQMDRLPEMLRLRRQIADSYRQKLGLSEFIGLPEEPKDCLGNWQSYMIALNNCEITPLSLMETLQNRGIPTRRGVMASHKEPCYAGKTVAIIPSLPNTEHALAHNLQLPMHPALTPEQIDYICEGLLSALDSLIK